MPGPVPGIHVFCARSKKVVDGRVKPGHDEKRACQCSAPERSVTP
jgi:hypothetical protein